MKHIKELFNKLLDWLLSRNEYNPLQNEYNPSTKQRLIEQQIRYLKNGCDPEELKKVIRHELNDHFNYEYTDQIIDNWVKKNKQSNL